jgi:plasmid segregation protein ParM
MCKPHREQTSKGQVQDEMLPSSYQGLSPSQEQEEDGSMKWYPFGHDFGNSEVSNVLVRGGQQLKKSVPTAFVRADINTMQNLGVEVDKSNAFVVQLDGEPFAYAFGDLAIAQGVPTWNGRGDDLRYASKYSIRAMAATSSAMIPDKEYGLYVVCGLPADIYMKNPDLRKQIKHALDGTYRYTMDSGKTWRTCHVEIANVVMEGAGALLAYSDKNAQPIGKDTEAAVIDIGGGTTDLYAQRGPIPLTEFCKNARIAVETATTMLSEAFEKKYRSLSQFEARAIMYAYASGKRKNYPKLSNYGKDITAEEQEALVKPITAQVGDDIASFVAATWRESGGASRFNPVLLIGGGFYYFYNVVKKRIPHLDYPEDPVHANATGYSTLAARLLLRKQQQAKAAATNTESETPAS